MAKKQITNIAASIKEKLANISRNNKVDYNSVFKQFVHERFLYRLSRSNYKTNFILKGALLFLVFDISRNRPTKDIDFLGKDFPNDLELIKNAFSQITSIQCEDGLVFDRKEIVVEQISELTKYKGIRVKLSAYLENARERIQIDIGFGDKIYKGPILIDYPILLEFPAPKIFAYSIESAIAEKFEEIVTLGIATSRMKDFYDIWFFANTRSFKSDILREAIELTFENRGTDINDKAFIFNESFKNDNQKQTQWYAYSRKNNFEVSKYFFDTVEDIEKFIAPLLLLNENKTWDPKTWSWD